MLISKIKFSCFPDTVKPAEVVVLAALEKHGGIMAEDHMLEYLLQGDVSDEVYCKHLLFLLDKLTANRILREQNKNSVPSWRVEFVDWDRANKTIAKFVEILESEKQPLTRAELLNRFKVTDIYSDHKKHYNFEDESADPIDAHLRTSDLIRPNPFDEWGLTHWNAVTPKRMGNKIYLVMKKHGKPLHFRDIATHINEAQFDSKKAYPPTVHNELILDDRYILVGRGIYALKEWGYVPGVVSDVIEAILSKSDEALTRDEIVQLVLDQRMVKKGTVYLALSNNNRFSKDEKGKYSLATQ